MLSFLILNRKGQQAFLGYLLLVGIVLSLVGAAYMWGEPLIRKNEARATVSNIEKLALEVVKRMERVILRRTSHDLLIQDVNAKIELSEGKVKFEVDVPLSVYTTEMEFPMNTGSYIVPDGFVLKPGEYNEIPSARITAYSTYVLIEDLAKNVNLTCTEFPCTAITSLYILKIYYKDGEYTVIPEGQVGILGSEPICVLLAKSESLGASQRIRYTITCRAIYSPQDNLCILPNVKEVGDVLYTGGKKRLVIHYKSEEEEIINTTGKKVSSICNILNEREIEIEFI